MAGKKGASSGAAKAKPAKSNKQEANNKKQRHHEVKIIQDETEQKQKISDHERKHQQRVLDIFRHAFADVLTSPSLTTTLQSVKQALFERDFARAFGDPEHLAVYAARWSPTRALCYASVLHGIQEHLETLSSSPSPVITPEGNDNSPDNETSQPPQKRLNVLSMGGGAAELVALGAYLNRHPSSSSASLSGSITLIDSGPWTSVVSQLTTALTTPPTISKYASAAAKLSNAAMVPASHFHPTFLHHDALALGHERLASLAGGETPLLITILFTLNELFTASGIGKTTAFLLDLTSSIPFGSLLLVVDSPGSYAEAGVGEGSKRYPIRWLLEHALLTTAAGKWERIETCDSVWFRLVDSLRYPIALENMRYQLHLYRVIGLTKPKESV